MISVRFQGKPFNITVIQVYAPNTNAEEAEVEWFYEDLQDLLELTPKKDILFTIGAWNTTVEIQEIPGVTGKFGLGVQNEAGQRLIEFCQENVLVIANTVFQQHKRSITYVKDRPGHDRRYAIDPTKISNELGWEPQTMFNDGIKMTIQWYVDNKQWWENILNGCYRNFTEESFI